MKRACPDWRRADEIRDTLLADAEEILVQRGARLESRQIHALAEAVAQFLAKQDTIKVWVED